MKLAALVIAIYLMGMVAGYGIARLLPVHQPIPEVTGPLAPEAAAPCNDGEESFVLNPVTGQGCWERCESGKWVPRDTDYDVGADPYPRAI